MDEPFYRVGPRAVTLRVKARPHAHEDSVLGARAGALVVAVRAVAEKGKANAQIVKVLATALGVSREQVVLKSGGSSTHKVFIVPLQAVTALERLAANPH